MLKYRSWGQQITDGVKYSNDHYCLECGHDYHHGEIIGLVINPPGIDSYGAKPRLTAPDPNKPYALIYECQKCFQKYWYHTNEAWIISMVKAKKISKEVEIPQE